MKTLYESAIADMTKMLEKTVDDFSMAYEVSGMEPLFCVSNKQFSLMKTVARRLSMKELCVADANAISHFDSVPSLLYLAYVERKMDIEEGIAFVRKKLERSYNKLSDRSKEIYRTKYQQVMSVLG